MRVRCFRSNRSLWLVLCPFAFLACGGLVRNGAGGEDGGTGGAQAGGTGGVSVAGAHAAAGTAPVAGAAGSVAIAICPRTAPVSGTACSGGLECSFGDDPRIECRARSSCSLGKWAVVSPPSACGVVDDCAELSTVPKPGAACVQPNQDCLFRTGTSAMTYCRCDACLSGACASDRQWDCAAPPASPCPSTMPNEGEHCETEGESCSYGNCPIPGLEMQCMNALWRASGGGCVSSGVGSSGSDAGGNAACGAPSGDHCTGDLLPYEGQEVDTVNLCVKKAILLSCSAGANSAEACWVDTDTGNKFKLNEGPCMPTPNWRACTSKEFDLVMGLGKPCAS